MGRRKGTFSGRDIGGGSVATRKKLIATRQKSKRDGCKFPMGTLQRIGDQPAKPPGGLSSSNWKPAAAQEPRSRNSPPSRRQSGFTGWVRKSPRFHPLSAANSPGEATGERRRLAVAEVHEPSGGEQGCGKPGKAFDAVAEAFPVRLSGNDAEHKRREQSEEDGGFEMGKREFRHGRQVSLSGLILFADGNLVGIHHGEDVQQPGSSKVDGAVIENEARR